MYIYIYIYIFSTMIRLIKGDTRSLDHSSYGLMIALKRLYR